MAHRFFRPANGFWLAGYLAILAAVWTAMAYGRARAIELYGTPQAQQDWEVWVEDAREASEGEGPVRRQVPKSAAPPAYLLMTEHYASCLLGAMALSSALFLSLMVMVRGVWNNAGGNAGGTRRREGAKNRG